MAFLSMCLKNTISITYRNPTSRNEEGILVEKARWGRSVITKGKIKIELSKDIDASKLTLEEVQEMIAKKTPAKKVAAKKAPAKKPAAKKALVKKK
jgi:DNA topoisomerase-1